jgi:hypothetical protein
MPQRRRNWLASALVRAPAGHTSGVWHRGAAPHYRTRTGATRPRHWSVSRRPFPSPRPGASSSSALGGMQAQPTYAKVAQPSRKNSLRCQRACVRQNGRWHRSQTRQADREQPETVQRRLAMPHLDALTPCTCQRSYTVSQLRHTLLRRVAATSQMDCRRHETARQRMKHNRVKCGWCNRTETVLVRPLTPDGMEDSCRAAHQRAEREPNAEEGEDVEPDQPTRQELIQDAHEYHVTPPSESPSATG